jgi:hypothetical protein
MAIDQKRRGRIGVAPISAGALVDDLHGTRDGVIRVRNHHKVREFVLRKSCCLRIIVRDDDHSNVLVGKLPLMAFELAELDDAKRSPVAPKEDQQGRGAAFEIRGRERRAVGKSGGELRNFAARLSRTSVCRTSGRDREDKPLEPAYDGEQHQESDSHDAAPSPY